MNIVTKAPRKEKTGTVKTPIRPNIYPITAPKLAPLAIPSVYGSTNGFCSSPCNDAPTDAKTPPAKIPKIILGNLTSKGIVKSDKEKPVGPIPNDKIIAITSNMIKINQDLDFCTTLSSFLPKLHEQCLTNLRPHR